MAWFQDINRRLFSCRNSSKGRQHPSSNMHCVTLVYSPFFFFVHSSVKVKKSAISSSDSSERHVFHSLMNKQLGGRACLRGWSMVYCLSSIVSRPGCWSISSPNKYTLKSMVYCSHLPLFGMAKNDVRYPRALSALRVADLKGYLVGFNMLLVRRFYNWIQELKLSLVLCCDQLKWIQIWMIITWWSLKRQLHMKN